MPLHVRHSVLLAALSLLAAVAGCAQGSELESSPSPVGVAGNADAGSEGGGTIRPPPPGTDSGSPPLAADSGSDAKVDGGPAPNAACISALAGAKFGFDTSGDGFVHGALDDADSSGSSWPFDPWQHGAPSKVLGCKSGSCWATELTTNYAQCQRAFVESPAIDLSACAGEDIALTFEHAYTFWSAQYLGTNYYDGGIVEVSGDGGTTWTVAGPYTFPGTLNINPEMGFGYSCLDANGFHVNQKPGFVQTQTAWSKVTIPIGAALRTASFKVRFAFSSGVSSETTSAQTSRAATGPGWHIDDVAVEKL